MRLFGLFVAALGGVILYVAGIKGENPLAKVKSLGGGGA